VFVMLNWKKSHHMVAPIRRKDINDTAPRYCIYCFLFFSGQDHCMPPPRFEKDKSIIMALEVLGPSWVVEVKMGIRLLYPKATSYFSWSLFFFK